MSFSTAERIDATFIEDPMGRFRYFCGPYRSMWYANYPDAEAAMRKRFSKAVVAKHEKIMK